VGDGRKGKEKDMAAARKRGGQDEKKRHGNDGKEINVDMYIATHRWRTMHRTPRMTLL
jgi:hypothetical protein